MPSEYRDCNPPEYPEFECPECGKPMFKEGHCSWVCWETSML